MNQRQHFIQVADRRDTFDVDDEGMRLVVRVHVALELWLKRDAPFEGGREFGSLDGTAFDGARERPDLVHRFNVGRDESAGAAIENLAGGVGIRRGDAHHGGETRVAIGLAHP